jgi:hypothetical protein
MTSTAIKKYWNRGFNSPAGPRALKINVHSLEIPIGYST